MSAHQARLDMLRSRGMKPTLRDHHEYERKRFAIEIGQATQRERVLRGGVDKALKALQRSVVRQD